MSNALAHRPIHKDEWQIMTEQASLLRKTGFLPAHIKTDEQALAIMMKARELDVPATYGLSNIAVIQGKPVANSELMLALIYRDHGDDAMHFVVSSDTECTVRYKRRHSSEYHEFSFTMKDAKTAGLGGQTWQKYPKAMLRARCISAVARMAFPDSIAGMYSPGEVGGEAYVSDDGEVTWAIEERTSGAAPMPADVGTETGEVIDVATEGTAPDSPEIFSLDETIKAIESAATPDGVESIYLFAKEGAADDTELDIINNAAQGRLLYFLEQAQTKADLEAVGTALKATELGSDYFRKEYKKAQERISHLVAA